MEPVARITSTKNALVGRFRRSADGLDPESIVADGQRIAAEGLVAGLQVAEAIWSERLLRDASGEQLLGGLRAAVAAENLRECTDAVLDKVSRLKTPQGVVVRFCRPNFSPERMLVGDQTLIVAAAGIQDPGNLGGILRSVEAASATGFIALRGSADPFRDKSLRAAAGSAFRLPVWPDVTVDTLRAFASQHSLPLLVADSGDGQPHWQTDLTGPMILVLGGEGAGVPTPLLECASGRLQIPMAPTVESLNVAVAAGVILFEAMRQRNSR